MCIRDRAYTSAAYSDQTMDCFSLFSCETVYNRGFNLPAVPAGETDENGVPIGNDFTSDVRVRRAINLAIDRQAMLDHVLNGHGTIAVSYTHLPGKSPGSTRPSSPAA